MKTHLIIFCVLLVKIGVTPVQSQDSNDQEAEEKNISLLKAINDFNLYFEKADADRLDAMLAENYMHTNGSSKPYTKEVWLNYIRSRKGKLESKALVMDNYGMKDIAINFYDNTALVNGVVYSKGKENGEAFNKKFRVTHLWVLESGQWKRAAFHDGVIE